MKVVRSLLPVFLGLVVITAKPAAAETYSTVQATPHGMALGDAKAPVTMIEYFSLGCGHCAHFHANELPAIKKAFIDTGQVRLILREFPHNRPSEIATRFARCMPAKSYLAFIERLLARQGEWMSKVDFEVFANVQQQLAATLSGDHAAADRIAACARKPETEQAVNQRRDAATASYLVQSVPSMVIGASKEGAAFLRSNKLVSNVSGPDFLVWTRHLQANAVQTVTKATAGASPRLNVANEKNTALILSLLNPEKGGDEVATLLANGAKANTPNTFAPPLVVATMVNKVTAAGHLIAKGAKLNVVSTFGMTPLMFAVQHSNKDMITLLLKTGADPKLRGGQGMTALDLAKKLEKRDIVEFLAGGVKL